MTDSPQARIVPVGQGQDAWAREAFLVLRETAATYGATITTARLAQDVQQRSGLHTRTPHRSWLGAVLRIVVRACHLQGMPPLTSLVVNSSDGRVGAAYNDVVKVAGLPPVADPDERETHAAVARLQCYQEYCDHVPDGATATASVAPAEPVGPTASEPTEEIPTPVEAPAREVTASPAARSAPAARPVSAATPPRKKPVRPEDEQRRICTSCFMEVPVNGVCPTCE